MRFGPTLANDRVDLDLFPGEIHGLVGQNGSGKTTLISLLYGLYQAHAGEITLSGERVSLRSPRDARRRGIGMVPQRFRLAPTLTVTENVVLGLDPGGRRHGPLCREVGRQLAELSERYGLHTDPHAVVGGLSMGEQQRVEILRALHHGARVLIMDEPMSLLTPRESERLFGLLSHFVRDPGRAPPRPRRASCSGSPAWMETARRSWSWSWPDWGSPRAAGSAPGWGVMPSRTSRLISAGGA